MSDQLEVGQRVGKNSVGIMAVDPQALAVRRYADPMRGHSGSGASLDDSITLRLFRHDDSCYFLLGREIDDRKAVEIRDLREYAAGRAVGVNLERHRTHAAVELDLPRGFFGLQIDDI